MFGSLEFADHVAPRCDRHAELTKRLAEIPEREKMG
jgi:hypothetical protein